MKNLNEEVNKVKYLFTYKKGDVITESMIKESSDTKTIEFFESGDKIKYDKGGFTVELTSDVVINEPGNFTYDIKVISSKNDEIKEGETGTLNFFNYTGNNVIDEYEFYIGKWENYEHQGYHKENIKPYEIKKIN
jgi:hypothetical protein